MNFFNPEDGQRLTASDILRHYELYYPSQHIGDMIQLISIKSSNVAIRQAARNAFHEERVSREDMMKLLRRMTIGDIEYVGW